MLMSLYSSTKCCNSSECLCPCTPQQNVVTESKHQHIIRTVQTLFLDLAVPASFQVEVVSIAICVINCKSSKFVNPVSTLSSFSPSSKLWYALFLWLCVFCLLSRLNLLLNHLVCFSWVWRWTQKDLSVMVLAQIDYAGPEM